jgi:hypothetical protein
MEKWPRYVTVKLKLKNDLKFYIKNLLLIKPVEVRIKRVTREDIAEGSKMDWYSCAKMLQGERENFYILKKNYTIV